MRPKFGQVYSGTCDCPVIFGKNGTITKDGVGFDLFRSESYTNEPMRQKGLSVSITGLATPSANSVWFP
jgi:hypothetical protein